MLTALEITGGVWDYVLFLGQPIIALALGLVVAIYGLANQMKKVLQTLSTHQKNTKTQGFWRVKTQKNKGNDISGPL